MEKDCGPKCRSKGHAYEMVCTVTKNTGTKFLQAYLSRCHNTAFNSDFIHRTVLHVAASCGKWELVDWLISEKGAEPAVKDMESGWTALHRALFYGQLHAARVLIMHGASLGIRDREGCTPLDLTLQDRLTYSDFITSGPTEVYTWGDNSNFTLGHDSAKRRHHHEMIDSFQKASISIKQVVMCKYHSVFLSQEGAVFTCGHGRGGRLGHGHEQTILVPRQVAAVKHEVCVQVAAGRDHTVMLMESGTIYSCGLNDCHQLGVYPSPPNTLVPKQMNGKLLRGKIVCGVLAQRYHTVIYTKDAVYTFGLNAGQLGHQKVAGEVLQSQPRQVAALNHKDLRVQHVACSDAATVISTTKGDVYVLHEYQCRKIVSKWLDIQQVSVMGGHLDHKLDRVTLREAGGSELVILLLNSSGKVFVWRASEPCMKRCVWSVRRPLHVTRLSQSLHNVAMVTQDGNGYLFTLPKVKSVSQQVTSPVKDQPVAVDSFSVTLSDLVEKDDIEEVKVERLPLVHRAVSITTDRKGQNTAVLQMLPSLSLTEVPCVDLSAMVTDLSTLFEEADTRDSIHDCVLQVGNELIPTHRFILSSRSDHFAKLCLSHESEGQSQNCAVIQVQNVDADLFKQLLKFIYTDSCDLICIGKRYTLKDGLLKYDCDKNANNHSNDNEFIDVKARNKMSAYQVQQQQQQQQKNKKSDSKQSEKSTDNPVKQLQEMAKKFGVSSLVKRLDAVKYVSGMIIKSGKSMPSSRLKFYRTKYSHLYDVCIQSSDGATIQCHKCVLAGRLEYFHSMLGSGWIETSNSQSLMLPIPGDILGVVIEYLYTDDAPALLKSGDVELICNVLVVADQLLITRLKHLCEVAITGLMNLKNVAEVLAFASVYNAHQLKASCQQYVCVNLPVVLEMRCLDVLSEEVMDELTEYYRNLVPGMSRRFITPYSDGPSYEELESQDVDAMLSDVHETLESLTQHRKQTRRRRKKSSCEDALVSPGRKRLSESDDVISSHQLTNQEAQKSPTNRTSPETSSGGDGAILENEKSGIPRPSTINITIPARDASRPWGEWNVRSPTETGDQGSMSDGEEPTALTPTSPPCTQLRQIMTQQIQQASPIITQQSNKIHGSTNKKAGKLSQKERKKLLLQAEQESASVTPSSESLHHVVKASPWAIQAKQSDAASGMTQSFRDLMLAESTQKTPVVKSTVKKEKPTTASSPAGDAIMSWGLPTSSARRSRDATPLKSPSSPAVCSPTNPWSLPPGPGSASASPVDAPRLGGRDSPRDTSRRAARHSVSFSDIVQEELHQVAALEKTANKPLALIQIEEKAIHELVYLYKAEYSAEEYITVERVPVTAAQPLWKAHAQ